MFSNNYDTEITESYSTRVDTFHSELREICVEVPIPLPKYSGLQ